jgi:hypothetical protein
MATIKIGATPGNRLEAGASILAAARLTDTRLVKNRLAAFERAYRAYGAAQRKVDAAERRLATAQQRVGECDAAQDDAVEMLARALVGDGHPRAQPFAAFGAASPAAIKRLAPAAEAKALSALIAALQRNKAVSKPTLQAAREVERAVGAVTRAQAPIDKLTAALHDARRTRDAIGGTWDSALGALKRGARAAADDGAPQLYPSLFERPARTSGRNGKRAPAPTPEPPAEPAKPA